MKTLVVVAHPNLETSKINRRWIEEIEKYPEEFAIHNLYQATKQGNFEIEKEQALVETYDRLVLQFPLYWFNCPPLLKKWLDDVFLEEWAFGAQNQMRNRTTALLVSAGVTENDLTPNGQYKHPLKDILIPFETTFRYMEANYQGFYAFYDAENCSTKEKIEAILPNMLAFLRNL